MNESDAPSDDDIDALLSSIERTHSTGFGSSSNNGVYPGGNLSIHKGTSQYETLGPITEGFVQKSTSIAPDSPLNLGNDGKNIGIEDSGCDLHSSWTHELHSGGSSFKDNASVREVSTKRRESIELHSPDEESVPSMSYELDRERVELDSLRAILENERYAFEKRLDGMFDFLKHAHVELNARVHACIERENSLQLNQSIFRDEMAHWEKNQCSSKKIHQLLRVLDERKNELINLEKRHTEMYGGRNICLPIVDRILELKTSAETLRDYVNTNC